MSHERFIIHSHRGELASFPTIEEIHTIMPGVYLHHTDEAWEQWIEPDLETHDYYRIVDQEDYGELWFYRRPIRNWNHYGKETKGYRFDVMPNTVGLESRAYSSLPVLHEHLPKGFYTTNEFRLIQAGTTADFSPGEKLKVFPQDKIEVQQTWWHPMAPEYQHIQPMHYFRMELP